MLLIGVLMAAAGSALGQDKTLPRPMVVERLEIDKVWAGHPVGFASLSRDGRHFVAYYDAQRRMTIATPGLDEKAGKYNRLPSRVGWDSHNYITMAFDRDGCLHVSGNMHASRLVYFRGEKPLDIASIRPVHRMTGQHEGSVTYPQFLYDGQGRLLFTYRHGHSGDGLNLVNVYDQKKKAWKRLLDQPLFDGRKHSMNAYPAGPPAKGPDGLFHSVWMWRDTPDCRTNHDICYARSRDLVHWQTAAGQPVELPITPAHKDVIVDPIPTRTGLINISYGLGFDQRNRPIVHYHNYDADGNSQVYLSRWEDGCWKRYQVSDWEYRWQFGGGGAIPADIRVGRISKYGDRFLMQRWTHKRYGSGVWKIDSETLKVVGSVELPNWFPADLRKVRSDFTALPMEVHWRAAGGGPEGRWFLRWETLTVNRDRPRSGPLPAPSDLQLYKVRMENRPKRP